MKAQFTKYCLLITTLFIINSTYAQTDQEFWFIAPEVNDEHGIFPNQGQSTFLRFSNTEDFAVTVTITQPATPAFGPITINIAANSTESIKFRRGEYNGVNLFDLDSIENYLRYPAPAGEIGNKGFKGMYITATGRITAYYEISAKYNQEIMSLKGKNALGTEFFVPFETDYDTQIDRYPVLYSAIDIVATENNTHIIINPTKPMMVIVGAFNQVSYPANIDYTITLQEGETFSAVPYDVEGDNDNSPYKISRRKERKLAGTKVTSDKPIAVNTKDDLVSFNGVDIVADQLVPVSTINSDGERIEMIGTDYIVLKNTAFTNTEEYAYVIATDDDTKIFADNGSGPVLQGTIDAGVQLSIEIVANTVITSEDSAVYVFHLSGVNYLTGAQFGGAILPTVSTCTGSYKVNFVRSSDNAFYMNILVRNGGEGAFELNGDASLIDASDFTRITPDWWAASLEFNTTEVPSTPFVNVIENTNNNVFHLGILNGYDDCFYGYFSDFNPMKVVGNIAGTINQSYKSCNGERIVLTAYGGITYDWSSNLDPSFLDNPTAQSPVIYPTEDRIYTVTAKGDCDQIDSTKIIVQVADPIIANFTIDQTIACSPLNIAAANSSEGVNLEYRWDFGDGDELNGDPTSPAGADTISHEYTNTTNTIQNLKLTLITENDFFCKDTLQTDIIVKPEIHADFSPDFTIDCNPLTVAFTDSSSGNLDKYRWIFGDGALSTTEGDDTHTYSHFNTSDTIDYEVELCLTSPYFCRDTARATISVFPYLEGGFTINKDNGCSPLDITFSNISDGADSISLDYGDGNVLDSNTFSTHEHKYTNTGSSVEEYHVVLTVFNDEGCSREWLDTITVYPEVSADYDIDEDNYTGCNERTVTFTNTSNDGTHIASQYLWTFGDGSNLDTTNAEIDHLYNNTYSDDHDYVFNLHAESQYGCSDDTSNTITIYRADANFTVDNNEGCSPLEVNINNTSVGSNLSYEWVFNNGDPPDNTQDPDNPVYNNTSAGTTTPDLELTVTGNGGCSTDNSESITVYPEIAVSFDTTLNTLPACDSLIVDFNSSIVHAGLSPSYSWDFGDGATSSTADIQHVYKNLTNANPKPYNVRLDVETVNGCTDYATETITVNPYVNANIIIDKTESCSPLTVNTSAQNFIGIDSYTWDYDDATTPVSGQYPGTHTFPRNQSYTLGGDNTYTIRLDVTDGTGNCNDFAEIDASVFSEIVADFTPHDASCNPYNVDFSDNSSLNAVDWQWDFDDATTSSEENPEHTFTNTSSNTSYFEVNLEVTSDRGCTHDTTATISVYPYVNADFDIDISEDCSPFNVTITNNSSGTEYYWFWNDSDLTLGNANSNDNGASISAPYSLTTGGTRIDSLTLIVGNGDGCYDTLKRAITVHSSIVAGFTYTQPDACNQSDVEFTNTTTNGDTYSWNFDDGSSLVTTNNTVNKTFTNNLTDERDFTVTMSAESSEGCTDVFTDVVTVYSKLISNFSISENAGCPEFTTTIDNTSIGNASNTYQWYIDNVLSSEDPTELEHTYDNSTTSPLDYEIKLIATNPNECTSEHTDIITVYEHVTASFEMDIDEGCNPLEIQFTDLSDVPADTKYTYNFNDGASSGSDEPKHTFYNSSRTSDQPYTIDLTVQSPNYCTDNTSQSIMVYHQPLAKFFIDNTSSCPPLETNLENQSMGEDSFEWRFGDGNPNNTQDNSLQYSYPNTLIDEVQNYTLELWLSTNEGCKDSTDLELSVFPDVIADFNITNSEDCSPLVTQFENESSDPAQYFEWHFDDGTNTSNQENPYHEFTNTWNADKTYDIFLKTSSEYNCWDTLTKQVTALVQPIAEFDVSPNLQRFPDNRVLIDNLTEPKTGPWNYTWKFGDRNTTESPEAEPQYFDYDHWGDKDIELIATSSTSNCSDAISKTISILPPEVNANFTTNISSGCLDDGLEVEFTATSSEYLEDYSYSWDFGDGETGAGALINHTFVNAGTFNVKMTAESNEGAGQDYKYKTIKVYSNPEVKFEVNPKLIMLDAVTLDARAEFYNLSLCNDPSGCEYLWDFGDDETGTTRSMSHKYAPDTEDTPIKYDIKLIATTTHGCADSLTLNEAVEIIGAGQIAFPNAFTPNDDGLNDVFKPVAKGLIKYKLLIYNRWGELIFTTKTTDEGWDGKINGELAKSDVYVWKAEGKFTNGRAFELAGDITLIR